MTTLTETEIRTLYSEKQREAFPRKRLWLGAFYACLFIGGTIAGYLGLFALVMKLLNV
jgi:hypothetical protein